MTALIIYLLCCCSRLFLPIFICLYYCRTQVIEEMILFAPDLVIISAGFDAHDEDPLANVELLDGDFQWATEVVMQACVTINPEKPVPG